MKHTAEGHASRGSEDGVRQERGDRTCRRRAASAAVAGVILLATASGDCSAHLAHSARHQAGGRPSPGATDVGKPRSGAMSARAGVRSGVMFGGDVPLATAEPGLGRKLAIVRVYDHLGRPFSNPKINRIMAAGTTVLVSLDTFPGGSTYAAIAAGREDAAITSWLAQVEQSAVRYHLPGIYATFEHEANVPSHHRGLGTRPSSSGPGITSTSLPPRPPELG